MFAPILVLWLCILNCVAVCSRKAGLHGRHTLAALGGSGVQERTFRRRWRLRSAISDDLDEAIRRELVTVIKKSPKSTHLPVGDGGFMRAEAARIRRLIVPEDYEVDLNKYWEVVRVPRRGFLGDVAAWVFGDEQFVAYSAWQYRPNIFCKGGNLTLEIHYKIPVTFGGTKDLFFEPIVVYTCDVSPGKYIEGAAVFSPGSVEILTHPLLPWRKIPVGTFMVTASCLPTVFSR
ncbi:uncharacterized protein BcabD6B2_49690 [Babesia caballi]|uniref:Transmembrane protein, putative n=1 Tax=Babesia caballi TaxID=5871 RepID=A0AAV4M3Y5_BABCB|nr:transmembrane protein, putative [Babesia caballi]